MHIFHQKDIVQQLDGNPDISAPLMKSLHLKDLIGCETNQTEKISRILKIVHILFIVLSCKPLLLPCSNLYLDVSFRDKQRGADCLSGCFALMLFCAALVI